jgi:hypothetical protein
MHNLDFVLIREGAGYRAACACGQWNYDGVVRDPSRSEDRRDAEQAWSEHADKKEIAHYL